MWVLCMNVRAGRVGYGLQQMERRGPERRDLGQRAEATRWLGARARAGQQLAVPAALATHPPARQPAVCICTRFSLLPRQLPPSSPPQIIRGQAQKGQLPPLIEYLEAARQRLRELAGLPDGDLGGYQST